MSALSDRLMDDALTLGARPACVEWTMHILDRLEILGIDGDFVECGVWHGAQPITAKAYVEGASYRPRKYWCFDTFQGMPPPGPYDRNYKGVRAYDKPKKNWLRVELPDVRENFAKRGLLDDSVVFVKGMVENTLKMKPLPEHICYLRLDTDFYSSTLVELQVLYPRLESGGALVVDDYGWWCGAQRATDEYFSDNLPTMLEIDRSAILIWKP